MIYFCSVFSRENSLKVQVFFEDFYFATLLKSSSLSVQERRPPYRPLSIPSPILPTSYQNTFSCFLTKEQTMEWDGREGLTASDGPRKSPRDRRGPSGPRTDSLITYLSGSPTLQTGNRRDQCQGIPSGASHCLLHIEHGDTTLGLGPICQHLYGQLSS